MTLETFMSLREQFFKNYMSDPVVLVNTNSDSADAWLEYAREGRIWYTPYDSVAFGYVGKKDKFVFINQDLCPFLTDEEFREADRNTYRLLGIMMHVRGFITKKRLNNILAKIENT